GFATGIQLRRCATDASHARLAVGRCPRPWRASRAFAAGVRGWCAMDLDRHHTRAVALLVAERDAFVRAADRPERRAAFAAERHLHFLFLGARAAIFLGDRLPVEALFADVLVAG